ncbi:MAG: hypothetical protein ACLPUO_00700 [Streptosporangiaceae bacterium]
MVELLGGLHSPIGWSVGWIEVPLPEVLSALVRWRRELGADLDVQDLGQCWPECLDRLDPLEAPWTTELLVSHAGTWTCYLNNDLNGRDPFPATGHLARLLQVRAVICTHQPMTPAGHASTQFQLLGPDGEPPLTYRRTIAAHAQDGRWSWDECGQRLAFEQPHRYSARRIRERLDREMLAAYLTAMGIAVDDDAAYAGAALVRQHVTWATRSQTLAQAKASWGLE